MRTRLAVSAVALALLAPLSLPLPGAGAQDGSEAEPGGSPLRIDLERGLVTITGQVLIVDDLLEYLLVNPRGAAHESLFLTEVEGSALNAAFLALQLEPGTNARYEPIEPPPGEEELRAGANAYRVLTPEGTGLYLYAAWREGDETYFFRVEDLVNDLAAGRSMRRHAWVYLGSRFRTLREGEPERFMADVEGNLVNISFFYEGNTLFTAALPECVSQTIWAANAWLLPPRGTEVALLFSRERLTRVPDDLLASLPRVERSLETELEERGG